VNAAFSRFSAIGSGIVALFAAWEIVGRLHLGGPSWPPISSVFAFASESANRALLLDAAARTAGEAFVGFLYGAGAGCGLAALSALVPVTAPGLVRLAAVVNGIPLVALASLFAVTLPRGANPVAVAAFGTFFMVFVAASAGLEAASSRYGDLFTVLGASRATAFARLLWPAALPAIADGLRLAAPVAVVGAIVGEWFAPDRGLGPLLVNAMQNYQSNLLWASALAGALVSSAAYAFLGAVRHAAAERYAP
jgi:NitT/TauT family transport system permease protein